MARIEIRTGRCKSCGLCVHFCPKSFLSIDESCLNELGYHPVQFTGKDGECTGCAICANICPDTVISVYKPAGGKGGDGE